MPQAHDTSTKQPTGAPKHPRLILEHSPRVASGSLRQSGVAEMLWQPTGAPAPQPCLAIVRHANELSLPDVRDARGYFIPGTHCRQGDILKAVSLTAKPVWIERGSFLAPMDLAHIAERFQKSQQVTLVESGSAFGYDDRVLDVRALALYQSWGLRVALGLADLCLGDGAASSYRPAWAQNANNLHLFADALLRLCTTWDCDVVLRRPSSLPPTHLAPSVDAAYENLTEHVIKHLKALSQTTASEG